MLLLVMLMSMTVVHAFNAVNTLTNVHQQLFARCPTENTTIGQGPDTLLALSELQCVRECSESDGCEGVVVCPFGDAGHVMCQLTKEIALRECLKGNHICSHCHLVYRMFRCENGGTPNGTRCQCPLPFAGTYCQRYMKDCTEGFENGHQDRHKGIYLIQPMTSLSPFLVRCRFDWGGVTYPLGRRVRDTSWSSVTWTQVKDGFGDDLNVDPDPKNYFIGLDKLHQLLSQSSYVGQIASSYSTSSIGISAFYFNFTVGPESSGYRLTYDSFFTNAMKPALNGLNASSPLLFSASGKIDANGCAGSRGAPGWYGSDCSGHSVFADPPTWPVPDQGTPVLNYINIALTRS